MRKPRSRFSLSVVVPRHGITIDLRKIAKLERLCALGVKHTVGTQYRHGGSLDSSSDMRHNVE